jgi:hypothetical protein
VRQTDPQRLVSAYAGDAEKAGEDPRCSTCRAFITLLGCIQEGLHRGFAEAPTSLMWPCLIVFFDPPVQIRLQLVG